MRWLLQVKLRALFRNDTPNPDPERLAAMARSLGLEEPQPKRAPKVAWAVAGAVATLALVLGISFYVGNNQPEQPSVAVKSAIQSTQPEPNLQNNPAVESFANEDPGELFAIIDDKDIEELLLAADSQEFDELLNGFRRTLGGAAHRLNHHDR